MSKWLLGIVFASVASVASSRCLDAKAFPYPDGATGQAADERCQSVASFDCSLAASTTEKALCTYRSLRRNDCYLNLALIDALNRAGDTCVQDRILDHHKSWVAARNRACDSGSDVVRCLIEKYREQADILIGSQRRSHVGYRLENFSITSEGISAEFQVPAPSLTVVEQSTEIDTEVPAEKPDAQPAPPVLSETSPPSAILAQDTAAPIAAKLVNTPLDSSGAESKTNGWLISWVGLILVIFGLFARRHIQLRKGFAKFAIQAPLMRRYFLRDGRSGIALDQRGRFCIGVSDFWGQVAFERFPASQITEVEIVEKENRHERVTHESNRARRAIAGGLAAGAFRKSMVLGAAAGYFMGDKKKNVEIFYTHSYYLRLSLPRLDVPFFDVNFGADLRSAQEWKAALIVARTLSSASYLESPSLSQIN
jgi:uncharacterized protein